MSLDDRRKEAAAVLRELADLVEQGGAIVMRSDLTGQIMNHTVMTQLRQRGLEADAVNIQTSPRVSFIFDHARMPDDLIERMLRTLMT